MHSVSDDTKAPEGGTLRLDPSFAARMILSEDKVKVWYSQIKSGLLSYANVKARMSWKRETFRIAGSHLADGKAHVVARLAHRGKTLCLFLPLDAAAYRDTKYKVEDAGNALTYVDTPCLYRIKNRKRVRYALELIDSIMAELSVPRTEQNRETFLPPSGETDTLIRNGLIKVVVKSKAEEAIFGKDKSVS